VYLKDEVAQLTSVNAEGKRWDCVGDKELNMELLLSNVTDFLAKL
jgi:hypothetical protein